MGRARGGHQAHDRAPREAAGDVPPMYAAVARPARAAGHSSWMYAIVTAKIPGVTIPCTKRHATSCGSVTDVAASAVTIASSTDVRIPFQPQTCWNFLTMALYDIR